MPFTALGDTWGKGVKMNAKTELVKMMELCGKSVSDIIWLRVRREDWNDETDRIYTYLDELDFRYDSGFGGQELFGYVVFDDNSWLERHEYDGSEWWEYKQCPSIYVEV
jgi:hypothetical protein